MVERSTVGGLTVVGVVTVVDGAEGDAEGDEVPPLQAVAVRSRSPAIRSRRIDSTVRLGGR